MLYPQVLVKESNVQYILLNCTLSSRLAVEQNEHQTHFIVNDVEMFVEVLVLTCK